MEVNKETKTSFKDVVLELLPYEWQATKIGEIISFSGGNQPPLNEFIYEEREGYIRLIQTRDYRTDKYMTYIPVSSAKKICKKDDIMIGRYGPPVFQIFRGLEGAYNVALIKASPDHKQIDKDYCYYFLTQDKLRRYIESLSQRSGGQTGIEIDRLNKYALRLPPLPEQKIIAECLSTWDTAIDKLSALVAKKELQKKALMQQLLTGKKRLKGFDGNWNKLSAGDLFKNISTKGFSDEVLLSATQDRGIIPRHMLSGRVTMPSNETTSFKLVEVGDFVISLRSFQGGLEYSYYRGIVSPAYTVLKPRKEINDEFYKQYFKSYDFIGHLAVAVIGIRDGKQISYEDFCFVKIPFPTLQEQIAIAEVLQQADKEIALLKSKLGKLKKQKKGLMQVLLTGKKRLKFN